MIVTLTYYTTAVDNTNIVSLGDQATMQKNQGYYDVSNNTPPQLFGNPQNFEDTIPQEKNEIPHPKRYFLCMRTQNMQLHQRTLLPLRKKKTPKNFKRNRAIQIISKILQNVMGSAAETSFGATKINSREYVPI